MEGGVQGRAMLLPGQVRPRLRQRQSGHATKLTSRAPMRGSRWPALANFLPRKFESTLNFNPQVSADEDEVEVRGSAGYL